MHYYRTRYYDDYYVPRRRYYYTPSYRYYRTSRYRCDCGDSFGSRYWLSYHRTHSGCY